MAVVFRARDESLGRTVALKVLAPALAGDTQFRERFIRESRAVAAFDHPHIIPVYAAGEADGVLYLAMRFVPAGDLRAVLDREGRLAGDRVVALLSPIASALDIAHADGLIHRDVKPANILVDARPGRPEHPYLSDFGLVKGAMASVDLTGKYCLPQTVHYATDTWFGPHLTASAVLKDGGKDWYLIVADYTFGHSLEAVVAKLVNENGGRVVGSSAYPFPGTTDYSSFLLAAQASGAKVIGLCNVGGDMENCIKQAAEFNLAQQGVRMAAMLGFITEAKSMGLETAQGLLLPGIFYWDMNDRTRAFTKRFVPKTPDNWPSDLHAACYSAVTHYLKGAAAMGVDKAKASGVDAINWMKANPSDDDCFGKASIRADGRFMTTGYLFQVKKPSESRGKWDYYKLVQTTPFDQAWRPLSAGGCPFIKA